MQLHNLRQHDCLGKNIILRRYRASKRSLLGAHSFSNDIKNTRAISETTDFYDGDDGWFNQQDDERMQVDSIPHQRTNLSFVNKIILNLSYLLIAFVLGLWISKFV